MIGGNFQKIIGDIKSIMGSSLKSTLPIGYKVTLGKQASDKQ